MSSTLAGFKRVGLHYIAFSELAMAKTRLGSHPNSKIAEIAVEAPETRNAPDGLLRTVTDTT